MKNVYFVFDQLSDKESGGLITTYVNFYNLMKHEYSIHIVSIFDCKNENKEIFDYKVNYFSKMKIDNRFFRMIKYLKHKEFKSFFHAMFSAFYFFFYIPIGRNKSRKFFDENDIIIAVAPAAAIFLSKKLKFLLEIHTDFDYFWDKNSFGRLQTLLMTKPKLTVFRNSHDAQKASEFFPSTYIYNFFNSKELSEDVCYKKNKQNKIIFVGRLHEHKDPIRLLDCAELLKKEVENFELDIYGTGQYESILKEEIIKRNLMHNVKLCGFTNSKSIYNDYKLLWLTSKREGFGLVIIEAKANYVPSISVNWGPAVNEVIEDKKDGFIVETNEEFVNKTILLLNNQDKLDEMSKCARENYLNRFSESSYKERWESIINNFDKLNVES